MAMQNIRDDDPRYREWPEEVRQKLTEADVAAHAQNFKVLCAVGVDCTTSLMSAVFQPSVTDSPDFPVLIASIAEMFQAFAKGRQQ